MRVISRSRTLLCLAVVAWGGCGDNFGERPDAAGAGGSVMSNSGGSGNAGSSGGASASGGAGGPAGGLSGHTGSGGHGGPAGGGRSGVAGRPGSGGGGQTGSAGGPGTGGRAATGGVIGGTGGGTGTGGAATGGAGTGGAATGGAGTGGAAAGGAGTGGAGTGGAATGGAGTGGAATGGAGTGGTGTGGAGTGGAATGGAGTGGAATGGAGTPATITVTDFGDHQVLQRTLGSSTRAVSVGGTYTGATVAQIQGQLVDFAAATRVIVPWTNLGVMSGGGTAATPAWTYSGALAAPQGGWYRIVTRGLDAQGNEIARAAGTNPFGVGINVLCVGQSNMVGFGGFSYTAATDMAGLFTNGGAWKHLEDPYDAGGVSTDVDYDAGSGASMIPSLANALAGYFPGIPIGIVGAAKGSAPLDCAVGAPFCWGYRNAANVAERSSLYGNSVARARAAGGVELVVMHQGETDATNMTPGPLYQLDLETLAAHYRTDLGTVPLFMCQLGRSTTGIAEKNRTDATIQPIRVAQHDADHPPSLYLAATAIDLDVDGTDHYRKSTYDALGRRIAAAIAVHHRAPGAPPAYRGPAIASATYADTGRAIIDVHLTHRGGTDFTPTSGINGFVVLDNGTPVSIIGAARRNATTIQLTLAAPIVGTSTVRYLYGKLPFQTLANSVHDNSPLELPLEPTARDLTLP